MSFCSQPHIDSFRPNINRLHAVRNSIFHLVTVLISSISAQMQFIRLVLGGPTLMRVMLGLGVVRLKGLRGTSGLAEGES